MKKENTVRRLVAWKKYNEQHKQLKSKNGASSKEMVYNSELQFSGWIAKDKK